MAGNDAPLDLGIAGMGAPAPVAETFVKPDRGTLGVAQIEVENDQPELAGEPFELDYDAAADAAAARPGRDKGAGDGTGESLRLVVARRARQLRRAGDDP